ncbi:MAG: hypothetical protein KDI77_15630 [Gammaproteobacteria bacterium]|nr:hypothetical protein [Gammaproteobacteria bacterium]MCW5585482.1 hypothetical protein [Chromatiales bacterium]HOP18096.1 hypothetical protein [Gammaproteobacteria bacterium]
MNDENPDVGETPSIDGASKNAGMNVYEAREGLVYRGPFIGGDAQYHYQQVAPNTLVAHPRDNDAEVAALEHDALGSSLTAMYDSETARQAALDAARELGTDPHAPMPAAFSNHLELREAFEYGRGDAYGIDY